jgi:phage/plasmid-associated DNA primase
MEFAAKDLLTEKEIVVLIQSDLPGVRAELLASKLKKYCFIRDEGDNCKAPKFYRIQPNLVYRAYATDINDKVKLIQQKFIEHSYQALSKQVRTKISTDGTSGKQTNLKIYKNSTFAEYEVQLMDLLTIDSSDPRMKSIDRTPYQIHFLNGYFDLKSQELRKREFGVHFVTKVINRDYSPSTLAQRLLIMVSLRKVYPIEEDLTTILMVLGSALSGEITAEQMTLFLIGLDSSGKSFIMELLVKVLECYVIELSSETFVTNNPKRDKILNSFLHNPQYLFAWINELKDGRIDEAIFKDFIDGKIKTTSLYADGQNIILIAALIIATMNTIPNFVADSGMSRRLNAFEHKSQFNKAVTEDDYVNHVYKANKFIISEFASQNLLNAVFDILASHCKQWIGGEKIEYPQSFTDATQLIVGSNDKIQDFIDRTLIITGDSVDRISKEDMRKAFLEMYPDKHLTDKQVIASLKEKKIEYNGSLRHKDKVRGVFLGVQFRPDDGEESDDDDLAYNMGIVNGDKSIQLAKMTPMAQYEYHSQQLLLHQQRMVQLAQRMFNVEEKKIIAKVPAKKGFGKFDKRPEGSKVLGKDADPKDIDKCLNDLFK